jgi:4-amino-4-deoxy-L-arabinose transferase-like glycosyltransferase
MNSRSAKLAPILLVGLGVRLLGITSRPIWYDEAFSLMFARQGPAAMLTGTLASGAGGAAAEEHPLGYYILLWLWGRLWGDGVVQARLLSVIFGLIVVLLIYVIARQLLSEKSALAAAALAALAPFLVHHSQEIRMYGLLTVFVLSATLAFLRAREKSRLDWRDSLVPWSGFVLASAAAQYTHNLAVLFLGLLALTPLLERDFTTFKRLLLAVSLSIVLYLPWLIQVPSQLGKLSTGFWTAAPGPERLLTAILTYVTNLPLPGPTLIVGLSAALLAVILAGWQAWRAHRQRLPARYPGLWFAYLAFGPLVALFLLSQIFPVFVERALLPASAFFWIWIAWALFETRLPKMMQSILVLILLLGFGVGLSVHITYGSFPYTDFSALNAAAETELSADALIIHSNKLSFLPAAYSYPALPQTFIADPAGSGSDTLAESTQRVLGVQAEPDIQRAAGHADEVWLVLFSREEVEVAASGGALHPNRLWLEDHFTMERSEQWADLVVYVYQR